MVWQGQQYWYRCQLGSASSTCMHNINIPAGLSAAHTILILNSLDRKMQQILCNNIICLWAWGSPMWMPKGLGPKIAVGTAAFFMLLIFFRYTLPSRMLTRLEKSLSDAESIYYTTYSDDPFKSDAESATRLREYVFLISKLRIFDSIDTTYLYETKRNRNRLARFGGITQLQYRKWCSHTHTHTPYIHTSHEGPS
jgi:hypothetical protein